MRISQSSRITNKLEQLKLELKKYQAESSQGFSDTIGDLMRDKLEALKEHLKG